MLSSFVVVLVSSTFLVQNNYYSSQAQRTLAQDNARMATELMASEIRSAMGASFVVAGPRTVTVRSPMVLGAICSKANAGTADVHTEGGQAQVDTDEIAGVGIRDGSTGEWTYANAPWSYVNGSDGLSAVSCAANGADTVGARPEFHRIVNLNGLFTPPPVEGDLLMLFRETTFQIAASALDTTTLGLFRTPFGGTPLEFATGIDATARFQFRAGGTTYADTIVGASLADIDAVRIVAEARRPAQTGGSEDITFGWSVNVAVRNRR